MEKILKGIEGESDPEKRSAAVYRRLVELDNERNRRYYRAGKGRYLVPLESVLKSNEGDKDIVSETFLSDHGEGVERMISEIDGEEIGEEDRKSNLLSSVALVAALMPEALWTLLLVVKNSTNRKESIWEMRKGQDKNTTRLIKNMSEILRSC